MTAPLAPVPAPAVPAFFPHDAVAAAGHLGRLWRELEAAIAGGHHLRMQVPLRAVLPWPQEPVEARASREARESGAAAHFLSMPAVSTHVGLAISKLATIFDRPAGDARPTVTALVAAFSTRTGDLLAMLDGAALTALKCAAISALVTDRCARADARVLAIAGTGVQAWQQARAVCEVRPIEEIRVWARRADRAAAFADELGAAPPLGAGRRLPGGRRVVACASLEEAVRGADIVGTATAAKTPLAPFAALDAALAADVHVNCMGGHSLESRELPRELLTSSILIVEDEPTAVAEAGDLHAGALAVGALLHRDVAELRRRRTILSSTGHAFLDLLTAAHLLRELGVLHE